MDSQSLLNGLKDLFHSLGAKTSDSNYGVMIADKSSQEPKGVMGMDNLASVLGVNNVITGGFNCDELRTGFYYYTEGGSNAPANYAWIITLAGGSDKAQLAWTVEHIFTRRRSGGSWSSWKTY